jgi:DNA replication protein DnaC
MEHISEILRRKQTQINISEANTDTWSDAEEKKGSQTLGCHLCKGAGFVYSGVPLGHPDFGKAIPCRCTQEKWEKESRSRLEQYSNLGLLARLTFDNLIPQGRSGDPSNQEKFKRAYEAAKSFAAEPQGWLTLVGPSGCGKTHLAAAIANECLNNNQNIFFITTPDLLDHLRSAFSPNSEMAYNECFDRVRNTPLLILDDLGTQTSTLWAKEKLNQLLNHRFNNELPTVITTSTPLEQLEARIFTRLTKPIMCRTYLVSESQPSSLDYRNTISPELLHNMTFDKFDWKRVNLLPQQRQNLEQAFRLAFNFAKSPDGWLVLIGDTGVGKTHLAASIANHRLQAGKPASFIVVPDFLDHLRATFSPDSKVSYDQLFESVKNAPLLILDDFGEQSTTPWAQEKLYQVINHRYNARFATVITTRLALEEIESPISSRLIDPKISLVWNINVPDYRGDLRSTQKTRMYPRTHKRRLN